MIRNIERNVILNRALFLKSVRSFFEQKDYVEVETPLLNPEGNFEPYIDPFVVQTSGKAKSPEKGHFGNRGFLITSPEYNLKSTLATIQTSLFQISHSFRKGDVGPYHTQEFLMLEWYKVGADDRQLMDEVSELIKYTARLPFVSESIREKVGEFRASSVRELFSNSFRSEDLSFESLLRLAVEKKLVDPESGRKESYDNLFFLLFLNFIELDLGNPLPEFVIDYPVELSANARVIKKVARRFELYIDGLELANGYFEITDYESQRSVFEADNRRRRELGRIEMKMDESLKSAMQTGLPECSGVALGLDRLFAILSGETDLRKVSPFL